MAVIVIRPRQVQMNVCLSRPSLVDMEDYKINVTLLGSACLAHRAGGSPEHRKGAREGKKVLGCTPLQNGSSDDLDQFSDIETTEADGDEEEECGHEALECLENDFVDDNETEENQETSLLTSPPPPPLLIPEEKEEITFGIGLKGEVFTEEQIGFIVKEEGDYGGEAAPSMEADQELANTEELNRRVEEFIREVIEEFVREVKEEIRIEAQQPLIAF
ncbi:hypothetical protein K2173_013160 [Erythroxylum novogranatense]|uniref:Uncharacterized protein n=1 Tax=Erythroxylum novogranatense TaxID=1862640 RepID=A0AAV8S5A7_9ROSI|nr:hypothetical protein K2173_013160 [Erythroxylum novogranatense]